MQISGRHPEVRGSWASRHPEDRGAKRRASKDGSPPHHRGDYFRAWVTSCVCVTTAASRPSPRVIRVCQTIVVRPRCSGVHSAFATSPIGTAAKKLVLLSIVVVD